MKKKILMAVLTGLCTIVCMGTKEKTTTGGVPVVKLNNGVEMLKPRDVTPEAKAIIELSRNKWTWMADKNVAQLAKLFHPEAVFVHMGGFWGTKQELETIEKGFIHYKKADIERDEEVRFADNTATLNSAIRLTAMVGDREVITPFFVTEVYIKQTDGSWKLSVLSFTSRPQMPNRQ